MQPSLARLRQAAERNNQLAGDDKRHDQVLNAVKAQQADMLTAFNVLISVLQGGTSKVSVTNQPDSIKTPDVLSVAQAVKQVEAVLKTHKNTDLSPLTKVMADLLKETKAIPKDLPKLEVPKSMTVDNLKDYSTQLSDLLSAIKAIKLVAEAPKINLPAPQVKVEPTNLKPLQADVKDVSDAVTSGLNKAVAAIKLNKPTEQKPVVGIVTEPFDEYRLNYDRFNTEDVDAKIESIEYYLKDKLVAKVTYDYDIKGRLTGGKRT